MSFTEFLPGADLRGHIAAYWVRKTEPDASSSGRRVYADGCVDLIYNAGYSIAHFYPMAGQQREITLHPGLLYLGGTMTAYGVLNSESGCLLTGIRFWPGGFYALFPKTAQPAVDSVIEFPHEELCKLMGDAESIDKRLDQWFADRPTPKPAKYDFAFLRKRMYDSGGLISVEALAAETFVSNRTLERIFKQNVGIPPKEFLRIVRFREVLKRLRNAGNAATKESLLQIAFELGYFDHAHLTNEFKKYSGVLPSELSHFYKTGIAGGLYF